MTAKIKRETEHGLLLANIQMDNKFEMKMILDTGDTNTTVGRNANLDPTAPLFLGPLKG